MATKKKVNQETGIVLVVSFFVLSIVNMLVIYFANILFPQHVVLGTEFISKTWAIIHSMVTLAFANTLAIPIVRVMENKQEKMFDTKQWMVFYFVLNFIGVWLIARFAYNLGLGISSWFVAAVLAVVLDVLQGFAMMAVEKMRKKT